MVQNTNEGTKYSAPQSKITVSLQGMKKQGDMTHIKRTNQSIEAEPIRRREQSQLIDGEETS